MNADAVCAVCQFYMEELLPMKKITRILALLLALVMLLGMAACGGTDTDKPEKDATGSANTTDDRPVVTVGLPAMPNVMDYENNAYTKYIEDHANVNLEFIKYAPNEFTAQIQTSVAGGEELPDILWGMEFNPTTRNLYGEDGYFIDLKPYFEKLFANDPELVDKYPFWEEQSTWIDDEMKDLFIRKGENPSTGEVYGFPAVGKPLIGDAPQNMPYINKVWLDKLGLDIPTNMDELRVVMEAFRTMDPNGNGVQDEIPMIGSMCAIRGDAPTWLTNTYIFNNDYYMFNATDDGELYYPWIMDEYREGLKVLREFVANGWLSTLTWTLASQNEIPATFTPADGVARCGVFFGHLSLRIIPNTPLLYEYEPLPPFNYAPISEDSYIYRSFITDSCDDPDLAFDVLMWMQAPEAQIIERRGEEGVHWEWQDNEDSFGNPCRRPTIISDEDPYSGQTTSTWGTMGHGINQKPDNWAPASPLTDEVTWADTKVEKSGAHGEAYAAKAAETNPKNIVYSLIYNEEEEEVRADCFTSLQKVVKTGRAEFATGVRDINSDADWNAYISEFYAAGANEMLAAAQSAYDREQARKAGN